MSDNLKHISRVRLAVQIDEEASIKTGTVVPDIDVSMIGKWASVFSNASYPDPHGSAVILECVFKFLVIKTLDPDPPGSALT
jgi:hypothetical protein